VSSRFKVQGSRFKVGKVRRWVKPTFITQEIPTWLASNVLRTSKHGSELGY
jgi:hypothetical protein